MFNVQSVYMRDDLHKKAAVPRRVSALFRLALQPAGRLKRDKLDVCAESALEQVLKNGFSQSTMDRLRGKNGQGEFFGHSDAAQARSPTEADFWSRMPQTPNSETDCSALKQVLDLHADTWSREMKATMAADGSINDAADVSSAISGAFEVAAKRVAQRTCGKDVGPVGSIRVRLDENLLASKGSAE